jgi:hypothetical protein
MNHAVVYVRRQFTKYISNSSMILVTSGRRMVATDGAFAACAYRPKQPSEPPGIADIDAAVVVADAGILILIDEPGVP